MARKAKKNAQGAGTIRKRSDGRWEARFTTGFDSTTGRQTQKSVYGSTQKEVREKLSHITVALDEGTYLEPYHMTLSACLDILLAEYMGDKKWSTVKNYKAAANTHIRPVLGNRQLSQLEPHILQTFVNSLSHGNKEHRSLNPKTVRNIHGILRKALAVAVQIGYLRRNPAESVILPRVNKKLISPLTDEQIQRLLVAAGSDGFGTLFKVVVFTGLRLGEALGLTWDRLDFADQRLTIDRQLQKRPLKDGGFVFAPLKTIRCV